MTFSSFYEMFDPLTTVRKQHFWTWFSGDDIRNNWRVNQIVGGDSTFTTSDSVDGGAVFTNQSASNRVAKIGMGAVRQFSHTGSECIFVAARTSSTSYKMYTTIGMHGDDTSQNDNNGGQFRIYDTGSANFYCVNKDSTTQTSTDSGVAHDTSYHSFKIAFSASNVIFTLDGTSVATNTTNLPSAKMVAACRMDNDTDTGNRTMNLRYFEAYNT